MYVSNYYMNMLELADAKCHYCKKSGGWIDVQADEGRLHAAGFKIIAYARTSSSRPNLGACILWWKLASVATWQSLPTSTYAAIAALLVTC